MNWTWQGWSLLDKPEIGLGRGPWVDLSQPLYPGMPRIDFFPSPRYEQIIRRPEKPLNVTEIQMVCHIGTHVDAPLHFIADGPAMDEIPLERFYVPGVVWRLEPQPFAILEPKDFENLRPRLRKGDILILDAGWWDCFGKQRYDQHYSLSPDAAQWLVDQQVKLLGVDCGTVDLPTLKREKGFNWPTHHVLLSNGVLDAEHLTNLRSLSGGRMRLHALRPMAQDRGSHRPLLQDREGVLLLHPPDGHAVLPERDLQRFLPLRSRGTLS